MTRYTLPCTEEQTRKSLELGAPIEKICFALTDAWQNKIPTAEEMIGWLEEQGVYVETKVNQRTDGVTNFVYNVICGSYSSLNNEVIFFDTRKEATLAAIDAALVYVRNLKQ